MGKIFGLIKNEWIKQYKKISVKIILILILVASIAAPFLLKFFNSNNNDLKWSMESYENQLEWLQVEKDGVDTAAKNAQINKDIIQVEIDSFNLRMEKKISWSDWRDTIIGDMQYKQNMVIMLNGIKSGLKGSDLTNNIYRIDPISLDEYYELSSEELQKEIDKFTNEAAELKNTIENNDYMAYLSGVIKSTEKDIEDSKKTITTLEADLAKDKENKEIPLEIEELKKSIGTQEELLKAYKYKFDNNIVYDAKDWKHNTVEHIKMSIEAKNEQLLTEEAFKQQYSWEINRQGYTYEKYQADREERIAKAEESLTLDWYSLENNIPQVQFIKDARNSLNETYLFYVTIAILLCIIIGGGIVSSEYSTGTVRLLMIRPVSRWKILFSKLAAVFIMGYGAMFTAFLLNIVSSGIAHGFGTLGTPMLALKDGVVVHQNFILSLIPNLMFASISLIFIIAVVFFFSTVGRNTALAVGLTMVGFLGSMPAAQVAANLKMTWIGSTFLPYVNLTTFAGGESWVLQSLEQMGVTLNATMGAVQLLVIAVVLTVISFLVFTKRDVTN